MDDDDYLYRHVDVYNEHSTEKISKSISAMITQLGEDVSRQGLLKTPERVARGYQFMTQGYKLDAHEILRGAIFDETHSEMIVVKDIELYSLCEHHLLPFFGRAHVAYIPDGRIVGLSKIARVVDVYAHRLQVQERLTVQIRDCIQETLKPLGVAIVIEAKHLCMMMRGVEKQNSVTTTSAFTGEFEKIPTRNEFFNLISTKLS